MQRIIVAKSLTMFFYMFSCTILFIVNLAALNAINLLSNYACLSIFMFLQILMTEKDKAKLASNNEKRKAAEQEMEPLKDLKKVS